MHTCRESAQAVFPQLLLEGVASSDKIVIKIVTRSVAPVMAL